MFTQNAVYVPGFPHDEHISKRFVCDSIDAVIAGNVPDGSGQYFDVRRVGCLQETVAV